MPFLIETKEHIVWTMATGASIGLILLMAAQLAPAADSTGIYYLVFLRPYPTRSKLKEGEGDRMQAAHMANIRKMADRGILVAAGL